jgi:hypothetical protein
MARIEGRLRRIEETLEGRAAPRHLIALREWGALRRRSSETSTRPLRLPGSREGRETT